MQIAGAGQGADLGALERRDEARPQLLEHLGVRLGDHRPVADEDHPLDPEPLAERLKHAGQRRWIGDAALMHLDRQRAALRRADQPPVDLQLAPLAIARVAQGGQRTAAPLDIGGGEVVEHEAALGQVAARQSALDALLAGQQPVHGREQLGLADLTQGKLLGERALRKAPRARELGARSEQQLADHRHHQVALP